MFAVRLTKILGWVGITVLAAVAAVGCGDDNALPDDAVAKIGDSVIGKAQFQRRLAIATAYQLGRPPPFKPTDYERCATFKQGERPEPGDKPASKASLVKDCKDEHAQARTQTMQSLVLAEWLDQEALAAHLRASPTEIKRALKGVKMSSFGSVKEYESFLKRSEIPESFFLEQARGQVLTEKLKKKARSDAPAVTEGQIAAYFARHQREFTIPEKRSLRVVLAKTEAKARAARRALGQGKSWKAVARAYSGDPAAVRAGGKVDGFARTGSDKPFEDAVFKASRGVIEGPLKTPAGWFVFEVEAITPARPYPLQKVSKSIEIRLVEASRIRALDKYTADFGARFQARTICADAFKVTECKNGPKTGTGDSAVQSAAPPADGNAAR